MTFKSSEIRWFSKKKELLWNLYENLPEEGEGIREGERTDYYLKSGAVNTGIKIREGNHELKVKCGDDEDMGYGKVEQWIKWSSTEEKNILNTVSDKYLDDWIAVKKQRFKKRYEIRGGNQVRIIREKLVNEGCGTEYTEIYLPALDVSLYTFGIEAFSAANREKENLLLILSELNLSKQKLKKLDSYGYPQLLHGIGQKPE